jgi:hypothetical protein
MHNKNFVVRSINPDPTKKLYPHGIAFKKEKDRKRKETLDYNDKTPFRRQDYKELLDIQRYYTYDIRYLNIMSDWMNNLKRKHSVRERSKELLQNYVIKYNKY